jgi:hypothetical protein
MRSLLAGEHRDRLASDLEGATAVQSAPSINRREVETRVRRKLAEWRSQAMREILEGLIRFWPVEGQRAFRFEAKADLQPMFAGVAGLPLSFLRHR